MAEKTADDIMKQIKDEDVEYVDIRFCDLPGVVQHFSIPASAFDESVFEDGLAFDGSSVRGFQSIHESDMMLLPDPDDRAHRPVPRSQDAEPQLLRARPVHPRGVLARPAQRGPQGGELPGQHRHRRHRVLRRGGRVLHLRLGELRLEDERHVLRDRLRGGLVEHRRAGRGRRQPEPRLQGPPQGRLLPRRAVRPLRRPARQDVHQPAERRLHAGARSPRGGHRRPGRDQLQVQHPAARGRRPGAVQVHHQEHRVAGRQDRHVHAEAAVRRQRVGHARPPVAVEGRQVRCSTTSPATRACRTPRATTSAASCTTRRRCWRSPTRR